jgi:hypothetical protein
LSGFTVGAGSVLVRRKKPKREVLLGLGAVTWTVEALLWERVFSTPLWMSGVGSRVGRREVGRGAGVRAGLGDWLREEGFDGSPNLFLPFIILPNLESVELVRRWDDGKLVMLLCITGDGSRNPIISAPVRLGRTGLRRSTDEVGLWCARWASSGGAWARGAVVVGGLYTGARFGDSCIFALPLSATTVDAEDAEFEDSLTEESACRWRWPNSSAVLCRTTGGRLCSGLACRTRVVLLDEIAVAGEYDDMDVGVEDTLKGPGDSEYRVEGVVETAYCGVGSVRISLGSISYS